MANNIDKEKIINKIIASSGGKIDKESAHNASRGDISSLMSSLSEEDRKKITEALSDKEKTRQLLSSDAAKQLLHNLFGKQ